MHQGHYNSFPDPALCPPLPLSTPNATRCNEKYPSIVYCQTHIGNILVVHGGLGLALGTAKFRLALRDLFVELVIVARRHRGLLLGLFGLGRRLLRLVGRLERLALLAHIGLLLLGLDGLGQLRVRGDHVRRAVQPQLGVLPDGEGHRLRALDEQALDPVLLLGDVLVGHVVGRLDNVLGQRPRRHTGEADLDGRVGGGRQVDQRGADGLADLGGHLGSRAAADLLGGLLGPLDALAILAGLPRLEDDGDGALGGGFVKRLAEQLGEAVDDAVVAEENVVLGRELALGLVLLVLGGQVLQVDDAGDALAQVLGEVIRGDDVLVVTLGLGDDQADGGLGVVVQRVGEDDLGGLQLLGVVDVSLGGDGQPDGGLGDGEGFVVVGDIEDVLFGGVGGVVLGRLLDVCQERFGRFQCLPTVLVSRGGGVESVARGYDLPGRDLY